MTALAGGLELLPPYRAHAVHRGGSTWAVGARSIDVLELPSASGGEIEIVWDGSERATRIDGEPTLGSVPGLESFAASRYDTWVVRALRLRDTLWEIELAPL